MTLYDCRAAILDKLGRAVEALKDAKMCITLEPRASQVGSRYVYSGRSLHVAFRAIIAPPAYFTVLEDSIEPLPWLNAHW